MFTGSLVTRIGISNKNLTGTGILKNYQVGNWIEPPPPSLPLLKTLFLVIRLNTNVELKKQPGDIQ